MRMTDFEQYDWGVYGRGYLSMHRWRAEEQWREGVYRHPLGIVEVYEQVGSRPHLSLRFRHNGRDYCRSWKTVWGDKTIARLAREFVEDVCRST